MKKTLGCISSKISQAGLLGRSSMSTDCNWRRTRCIFIIPLHQRFAYPRKISMGCLYHFFGGTISNPLVIIFRPYHLNVMCRVGSPTQWPPYRCVCTHLYLQVGQTCGVAQPFASLGGDFKELRLLPFDLPSSFFSPGRDAELVVKTKQEESVLVRVLRSLLAGG